MTIEEIKGLICDKYCRFPYCTNEQELGQICDECPLNELKEDKES